MPHNKLIEIGDKFGKLTVLENQGLNKFNYYVYKVKCECGKEKKFSSQNLRHRICCGCEINRRPKSSHNYTGEIIGDLIVKKENRIGKSGHIYYDCECNVCKSKLILPSNRLYKIKNEKIKNCKNCFNRSTPQIKDITGTKIGKLTIIKLIGTKKGNSFWEGICECGNKRILNKTYIKNCIQHKKMLCCKKCVKEIYRKNYFKNVKDKEFYHKNKIEIKVDKWLNSINANYQYNFILHNLFQYDFIVNDNILIEVQGDYWHANPLIYKKGPIYDQQKERVNQDKIKLKYAIENGYKIYYIWEYDIKNNNFSSLEEIKKII